MLGWSDKSVSFIKEICLANESEGGGIIIVLADEEKEILEAELESHMQYKDMLKTKVVFRHGNPLLLSDLNRISANTARSIALMSTGNEADRSDACILRSVLSINSLSNVFFALLSHFAAIN